MSRWERLLAFQRRQEQLWARHIARYDVPGREAAAALLDHPVGEDRALHWSGGRLHGHVLPPGT